MVVPHLRTALRSVCSPLQPFGPSDACKLARGAPCFTGLIGGYYSHWLRRLFRPHWAYFGLFRALRARFVRSPLEFFDKLRSCEKKANKRRRGIGAKGGTNSSSLVV